MSEHGARTIEATGAQKTWLILREPGKVPERKGPFPHSNIAVVLREFMKARPSAYITVLTWGGNEPDVQDGPECLEMADGRSSSIASRHRSSTIAASGDRTAVPHDQREPELGWLQGDGETIRERRPSDDMDELCAACGESRREHVTPGGTRYGPTTLCGAFIPREPVAPPSTLEQKIP